MRFHRGPILGWLKNPILISVAQIFTGNLVVMIIQFITGFVMGRWVLPYDMGIWNTINLVSTYTPLVTLGIYSGLNRELPYLVGKGELDGARNLARAAYAWSIVLALATVPVILVGAIWTLFRNDIKVTVSVIAVGLGVISYWFVAYFQTTYRTHMEFGRLSQNNVIGAVAGLILMVLVWQYGYFGMLVRFGICAVIAVAVLYYRRPMPVRPRWTGTHLVTLVKVGVPIYAVGQLYTVYSSMDRVALVHDTQALGYYSIAMQASMAATMIPGAFGAVIYPRMCQMYGETHEAGRLWRLARKVALGSIAISFVVGLCGWVLVPVVVPRLIPNYVPGIRAAQWASFQGVAFSLYAFTHIFNVIKKQQYYPIGWAVGMGSFWLAWMLLRRVSSADPTVVTIQALLISTFFYSATAMLVSWFVCERHDLRMQHA